MTKPTEGQRLYLVRVMNSILGSVQTIRNIQRGEGSYDGDQQAAEAWSQFQQAFRQLQNQIDGLLKDVHHLEFTAGWRSERIRDLREQLWDAVGVGSDRKTFNIETERLATGGGK